MRSFLSFFLQERSAAHKRAFLTCTSTWYSFTNLRGKRAGMELEKQEPPVVRHKTFRFLFVDIERETAVRYLEHFAQCLTCFGAGRFSLPIILDKKLSQNAPRRVSTG